MGDVRQIMVRLVPWSQVRTPEMPKLVGNRPLCEPSNKRYNKASLVLKNLGKII